MFVCWLTGLPGSGKTTIGQALKKRLDKNNISNEYIELDSVRNFVTPKPKYTEEERDKVYRFLVWTASILSEYVNVLVDATAHRRKWRNLARKSCKNFCEVRISCPLRLAIKRETERTSGITKKIYEKALKRLKTGEKIKGIGEVPGVDVPYEEPKSPEITINSAKEEPSKAASKIFSFLKRKKWI